MSARPKNFLNAALFLAIGYLIGQFVQARLAKEAVVGQRELIVFPNIPSNEKSPRLQGGPDIAESNKSLEDFVLSVESFSKLNGGNFGASGEGRLLLQSVLTNHLSIELLRLLNQCPLDDWSFENINWHLQSKLAIASQILADSSFGNQVTGAAAAALAVTDTQELVKFATSISKERLRALSARAAIQAIKTKGPMEGVKLLRTIADVAYNSSRDMDWVMGLNNGLGDMVANLPQDMTFSSKKAIVKEFYGTEFLNDNYAIDPFGEWLAKEDPVQAIDFLSEINHSKRPVLLGGIVREWADRDLRAASEFALSKQGSAEERQSSLVAVWEVAKQRGEAGIEAQCAEQMKEVGAGYLLRHRVSKP